MNNSIYTSIGSKKVKGLLLEDGVNFGKSLFTELSQSETSAYRVTADQLIDATENAFYNENDNNTHLMLKGMLIGMLSSRGDDDSTIKAIQVLSDNRMMETV